VSHDSPEFKDLWADGTKHVASTTLDDETQISTVFLSLDHNWGDGPPLIFETMVFGGKYDQEQERYATETEALAGHERWVAKASERVPDAVAELSGLINDTGLMEYGNSIKLAEALLALGVRVS
jgi:hypothetical protein